jgi:hypothetical protein
MANIDSAENVTPQWYIEPLGRHVQRFRHVADVMNHIGPILGDWHESTEGEVTAVVLLLAELASEPDRENTLPNGMTPMLLRIEKGALKCSWSQLTVCLTRSLDAHDTTASIYRILEELSKPMNQAGGDYPLPPQAEHTDMDPSLSGRIRCLGSGIQRERERDNVVYWKTKGKINNDLQYQR